VTTVLISCLALERPGKWRGGCVALLLVAAGFPAIPLLWRAVTSIDAAVPIVGNAFGGALWNSVMVALVVAVVAFVVGIPLGLLAALYEFPGRKLFLAVIALPLLVPSFLWAIGWSSLAVRLGPPITDLTSGFCGCSLVFSTGAVALVLLVSSAATATLSNSQVDAARLSGGEKTLLVQASRHVAVPALLAAGLGGVLTLSDPGPGQILGLHTAATEILTSFSALYDFALAGRQGAVLMGLVLLGAVPLAYFATPQLASELLAHQARFMQRVPHRLLGTFVVAVFTLFVLLATVAPVVGLTLPLVATPAAIALQWPIVFFRTISDTLIYAAGAGTIAAVCGFFLALCAGRSNRLRMLCLGVCLALFSLPPAVTALGFVQMASRIPAWADPFLRSRLTVCVALALRFLPVAAVLGLRTWGSISPSWALAAAVHGVPLWMYLRRVVLPMLLPAGVMATLLVGLLATADVSTVLLLHPPGAPSLPLAIFTVMANAPESLVATQCLVYIVAAGGLLVAIWAVAGMSKV
jgi:iron(III) transport system permease protein